MPLLQEVAALAGACAGLRTGGSGTACIQPASVLLTKYHLFAKVHDGASIPHFSLPPNYFDKNAFAALKGTSWVSECAFVWCSTEQSRSLPIPCRTGNKTLPPRRCGGSSRGGMRSNPQPHGSCQLETGCLWSRGSKSAAWRDLSLRCQPPVQLCRGDRGTGGPVPHPALCPQQGAVSAVGWLAVGLRGEPRERGDRTRGWLGVRSLCCSL